MNKRLTRLDQSFNGGDRPEDLGVVHEAGVGWLATETLCGRCDTGAQFEETSDSVDCRTCLGARAELTLRWRKW